LWRLEILPILVMLMASVVPVPTLAQEDAILLIGYGGERFLPFLDGARYKFVVGERVLLKALMSDVTVVITDRRGGSRYAYLRMGEATEVARLSAEDVGEFRITAIGVGVVVIEVIGIEESALGDIEVTPLSPTGEEEAGMVKLTIRGSSLSGFAVGEQVPLREKLIARPGASLHLLLPPNATSLRAVIRHYEPIVISGYIGRLYVRYSVDAVVAEYLFNELGGGFVDIPIPRLGEVGESGIVPLRYGTLILDATYVVGGATRFSRLYEVLIAPVVEEPPHLSAENTMRLDELMRVGIRVVALNLTTGRFGYKLVEVPHYRVAVYDSHLKEWVDDFSISIPGYLTFKNGSEVTVIPKFLPLMGEGPPRRVTVLPRLTVYSIDVSYSVGPLTLEPGSLHVISVEGKRVEVEVRHAAGFLIGEAHLYVNDTLRGVGGFYRLKLPRGTFNFSAETPYGRVSQLANIDVVERVSLVVRGFTVETMALISILAVQLSILSFTLYRLIMRRRRGGRG